MDQQPLSAATRAAWWFALAGLAALAGCGQWPRPFSGGHCTGGECKVRVTLAADCRIDVVPERLPVPPGGATHILWKIDAASAPALFDANGISFPPGQNPDAQFDEKEMRDAGKTFHWRDQNTLAGEFKYAINLRDANGRLCHLDPFIQNR